MKIEDYIDRKALRDRLDGDFDLLKELAQLFLSDSPKLLSAVVDAVENKNGDKIGKSSHTIKGAVANFSADRAFKAAHDLEKIGRGQEFEKAGEALKNLTSEVEYMREALRLLMEEKKL